MTGNDSESNSSLGRKRYLILVAGMIIQLCAGIIYMWSVFKSPVSEHLGGWDATLTASIMLSCFVLGILIGGRILGIIGPRKTCIMGSVLMSLGILLSSFVTKDFPEAIYLTYGIMGGFGVGTIYTCTVSPIQRWFFDKRGFATGMMVCAFGFSMVIFAPLATFLIDEIGVSDTFLTFGVAFLIICVLCSTMIVFPPESYSATKGGPSVLSSQRQYETREMLKTKAFYLITFSMFFMLSAYFILNPNFKSLGMDRGLTSEEATLAIMLTGASSASGRLVLTWLSDKIGRMMSMFLIIGLTLLGVVLVIFAEQWFFVGCICIISFAFGASAGVYATLTADNFGTKNMGNNYGMVMLGFGASALIFQTLSKMITEDGDYTMSFAISAVVCVIAFLCILLLRRERTQESTA